MPKEDDELMMVLNPNQRWPVLDDAAATQFREKVISERERERERESDPE